MRAIACLVIAFVVAACLLPARLFSVQLGGDGVVNDLPVTLEDRTDLVQVMGPAQPGQFNLAEGVTSQGDPSALVVTWMGGVCDLRTHLVLAGRDGGYTITETTERRPGVCALQGFLRTVTVGLSTPVDPQSVRLVPVASP